VLAHSPLSHVAFAAPSRESSPASTQPHSSTADKTTAFPELCPEYGPNYYAAFIIDPDGYRIEAVINDP